MNPRSLRLILTSFASLAVAAASALAADPNGKAADNHIYAQKLVNELMAQRSDLMIAGLHGIPAGTKEEIMLACNLDHIGNPDTEFDKASGIEHMTLLEPKTPEKFEMTLPLLDASGGHIGAVVLIFKRGAGETELDLYRKGLEVQGGLAKKIPSFAALFAPAKL
jgi:hypothetical protein